MPIPALVWEKQQQKRAKRAGARASVGGTANVGNGRAASRVEDSSRNEANSADGPNQVEERKESKDDDNTLEKTKTAEDEGGLIDSIGNAARLFSVQSVRETGPLKWMNPTKIRAHLRDREEDKQDEEDGTRHGHDEYVTYRARDHRKERGGTVSPPVTPAEKPTGPKNVLKGIWNMCTYFPYWEMAWWSGWTYSFGSALFVLSAGFGWTSLKYPDQVFPGQEDQAIPISFFVGAVLYQIGAVASYFEAINTGPFHSSSMGNILKGHFLEEIDSWGIKINKVLGRRTEGLEEKKVEAREKVLDPEHGLISRNNQGFGDDVEHGKVIPYSKWHWYPSWYMLKTHHIYEIGYVAVTIQLFGVTLYGVTAIIIFPGIYDTFNDWQTNVAYWIPQMVAAAAFLTASVMFTIEMQDKWWKPELHALGWHIGFWSIIGSIGFELSGAFGPTSLTQDWAEFQVDISSFWGSTAYLIGSLLQWYESVNKNPVTPGFDAEQE